MHEITLSLEGVFLKLSPLIGGRLETIELNIQYVINSVNLSWDLRRLSS